MNWIHVEIMPPDWSISGHNPPCSPDAVKALASRDWVRQHDMEHGQALDLILPSGARIDGTLHLRREGKYSRDPS